MSSLCGLVVSFIRISTQLTLALLSGRVAQLTAVVYRRVLSQRGGCGEAVIALRVESNIS